MNPIENHPCRRESGMALMLALVATVVVVSAAALLVDRVHASKRQSDFAANQILADEAAKGAIDLGIAKVWSEYQRSRAAARPNPFESRSELGVYRAYLDAVVPNDGSVELIEPGTLDIGGAQIARLAVSRQDSNNGTELTIETAAIARGRRAAASQTVIIGPAKARSAVISPHGSDLQNRGGTTANHNAIRLAGSSSAQEFPEISREPAAHSATLANRTPVTLRRITFRKN